MNIPPQHIRIDCFRTRKQSNWLDSCPIGVRMTHLPTKLFVEVDKHKSIYKNREEAFKELEYVLNAAGVLKTVNQNDFYIMSENKS